MANAEGFRCQVEGADLLVFPVHIHDDDEAVSLFKVLFQIGDDLAIRARNELNVEGALEAFVLVADGIHTGDLGADIAGLIEIPGLELIFFAVVIFLFSGEGLMVEQLIGGAIEADVGRERGSEHVAADKGGTVTCLQVRV